MTWQLALTGLLIGTLVGLTGMGGGSLMTPMLVFLFGFQPTLAIGTDILHGAVFKSFGAIRHRRLGNVQARLSGWMFLASAPMSLLGVWLATWIEGRYGEGVESLQGQILGGALVFGSLGLLLKSFVRVRQPLEKAFILSNRDRIAGVLIGLIGGFIVGLTSVGSGTFFALTMLIVFPLKSMKVVGTDIFHAAALLWVAGAGHFVAGNVDLGAVGWLLLGSIPGVLIGSELTTAIPDRGLRVALAATLAISGIKLLDPPGSNAIIVGAFLVGLVVLLGWLIRARAARRARVQEQAEP
ncbi:MAG: sulfite exporter TauE/SafE family protein [Gaiellaceae bacterium]